MTRSAFALRARFDDLDQPTRARLLQRCPLDDADWTTAADATSVSRVVADLIADVRSRGDAALLDAAERFDGARPADIEVPRSAWADALDALEPPERNALREAAEAVLRVHEAQRPKELVLEPHPGVRVGRRPDALARAGVYAPGGSAAYPSSVLMGVIPAKVAGVGEVVVCSPPQADGMPHRSVLAACAIAGADRVFAVGGAPAIAALAYGTATIPAVDRIVGPGSVWVDEAKRQVARDVGIDNPAGPSEIMIICDDSAHPASIAAELLAQAEHDPNAAVLLISLDDRTMTAVERALEEQLALTPRRKIAAAALAARGAALVANHIDQALVFAAEWAPEHLLLRVRQAEALLPRVRNAGAVFAGESTSVVHGDYLTGGNHVLPTGGAARFSSGMSVLDFIRWTSWQTVSAAAARRMAEPIAALAMIEGLPAHAAAARRGSNVQPPGGEASLSRGGVEPRETYRDFTLYAPQRPRLALDLSANTSRWGVSPAVERQLGSCNPRLLAEYPTPYADALRDALAAEHGVARENVTTGCGADDVIDSALRAFCPPGSVLAYPEPTFPMADFFARMNDLRIATVGFDDEGGFDVDDILMKNARAIYVCSPNNPTGTPVPRGTIAALLDQTHALVLLDEAYVEFSDDSQLDLALASERALIVRTFSKAAGLAGARVGFALGAPTLISAVEASRGPYKVGALAEQLAIAALQDRAWRERAITQAVRARERLGRDLEERGLRVWPSRANFVLCAPRAGTPWSDAHGDAAAIAASLRAAGVGVRAFANVGGPAGALRITVAPEREARRLLEALDTALTRAAVA